MWQPPHVWDEDLVPPTAGEPPRHCGRVATETRPKPSGPESDPPATGRPSPAPFLTGELRRAIANGSHLLARKGLGRGPGSCYGALKLVPDCLDARVTGHPQAHLGNSAAGGGSWTGDGALKPSPYQGDLIASRLPAPTLNNLAHHRAGAGEPLVLLHGVGESAVGWQPIHQALSDNYDVIAFDLPGFGRSPDAPPRGHADGGGAGGCHRAGAGPAWRGPVPRRRVFPGCPGRPRARHPGPHPFGHRDRPRRAGHAAGTTPPGGGTADWTNPGHAARAHCQATDRHRSRTVAVLCHGAEPTLAVARR